MAKNRPFSRDFYYFKDTRLIRKHFLDWMLFDRAAENQAKVMKPRYAKFLKDLLPVAKTMAEPVFFLVEPTAALMYVPVTLSTKKASITVLATPDSGADVSCFPYEVAEALGIDIGKLKKAKAFAGPNMFQVESFPAKVHVTVGDADEGAVGVVDFIKNKDARALLGWSTFFSTHEVVFSPDAGIKYRLVS